MRGPDSAISSPVLVKLTSKVCSVCADAKPDLIVTSSLVITLYKYSKYQSVFKQSFIYAVEPCQSNDRTGMGWIKECLTLIIL